MSSFEVWKREKNLPDYEVLDKDYLKRLKIEPEFVPCACGCGELRIRFDKGGIERRFIQGHQSRGHKQSAETINKIREAKIKKRQGNQHKIIRKIYNSLPVNRSETAGTIALKAGISRETCLRNLEIIDLIFSLQSKKWLEIYKLGTTNQKYYSRKPKRSEKVDG